MGGLANIILIYITSIYICIPNSFTILLGCTWFILILYNIVDEFPKYYNFDIGIKINTVDRQDHITLYGLYYLYKQ